MRADATVGDPGRRIGILGPGPGRVAAVAGVALLAVYAAGVAVWAVAAATRVEEPWRTFADPTRWWPTTTLVVVLAAALVLVSRSRRRFVAPSTLGAATLATSVFVLGMSSYWGCAGDQTPGWTPLAWTLALFLGDVAHPFGGASPGCSPSAPAALGGARLAALVLLTLVAQRALFAIFADRAERWRALRSARRVIVTDATEAALPYLRAVRQALGEDRELVVVGTSAEDRTVATAAGARFVVADAADDDVVRHLVRRGRRPALDALHVLGDDPARNLRIVTAFSHVVETVTAATAGVPGRLVVRFDDPWQAEDWRRHHLAASEAGWLLDAVSAQELAARAVVDATERRGIHTIVLHGASTFALAVLAQLTVRRRERDVRRFHATGSSPVVYLVGPGAQEVAEQYQVHLRRYGSTGITDRLFVRLDPASLEQLMEPGVGTALVLCSDIATTGLDESALLAARHPDWFVVAWDSHSTGLSDVPVIGGMYVVGRTLEPGSRQPLDQWEWFGRQMHARYLDEHLAGVPVAGDPSRGDWDDDLTPFVKDANIRAVAQVFHFLSAQGWEWFGAGTGEVFLGPTRAVPAELAIELARAEHESWRRHHENNGWRPAAQRDISSRRHPDVVPWDELGDDGRNGALETSRHALALLDLLGYRLRRRAEVAHPAADRPSSWASYARVGTVGASRLDRETTWTTSNGDVLTGAAGDWLVVDDHGVRRTVVDDVFADLYRPIGGGRYTRTGTVLARRAEVAQPVATLEGEAVAHPSDWLVIGPSGEQWAVPDEVFRQGYRTTGATPDPGG